MYLPAHRTTSSAPSRARAGTLSDHSLCLLKQVLAIPTKSRLEAKMIAWLMGHFHQRGVQCAVDPSGNVYVTKGRLNQGYYPCVIAHTDSVHDPEPITIAQHGDKLIALDLDRRQTGLGGDDKAGIFICLQLLEQFTTIKAAYFVSEEIGCVGANACDPTFFQDVGYALEFDSPCQDITSYLCQGVQLFPDSGPFADQFVPLLSAHGVNRWQNHPFTDACVIKRRFPFPCPNLPAGYFRMHSRQEYVRVSAVANSLALGSRLITALGPERYEFIHDPNRPSNPAFPVTELRTHG